MHKEQFLLDVIVTGGTIDKYYDPILGTVAPHQETSIPDYLKTYVKIDFAIRAHTICMIDSLDMTDDIRAKIADEISNCGSHVLITHGTDTMSQTAEYLLDKLGAGHGKTIALTGAMIPLAFHPSDGGFNLGYAIGEIQTLPSGIYVCMNGMTFEAGTVTKNVEEGRFVAKA